MNNVAITPFPPFPTHHGDAVRRLMLLRTFADGVGSGSLTIVSGSGEHDPKIVSSGLKGYFPNAQVIVVDTRSTRVALSLTPRWIRRQCPPAMVNAIKGRKFDVALLLGESAGLTARHVSARRLIWDKSNVLVASDLDGFRHLSSFRARIKCLARSPLSFVFERRVLSRVTEVVVTSQAESKRLRRWYGSRHRASVVPSAVEMSRSALARPPQSGPVAWLGTFGYPPNWDGLIRLARLLDRAHYVEPRIRIIGAGATEDQRKVLGEFPFLDYVGFVPDLEDALSDVRCGIVPVWAGAGVKLKTLTLLREGVPVISTSVGLEGIPEGLALAVADSDADWLAWLGRMRDVTPVLSGEQVDLLMAEFSPATLTERLLAVLEGTHRAVEED